MPTATKKLEAWFDWQDDPDGARVRFALLTDQDVSAIKKVSQQNIQFFDQETKSIKIELRTMTDVDRQETAKRAVLEWENFFDGQRKPMECTPENIIFWSCDAGFMAFLYQCQSELLTLAKEQQEAARKN